MIVSTVDAEYNSVHDVEVSNTQRRKIMITVDGIYITEQDGEIVALEKEGDVYITHPMNDRYADEIAITNDENLAAFDAEFGSEELSLPDWFRYNTELEPYIKRAADAVHLLRKAGYNYKVRMTTGQIVYGGNDR